ncbi:MAG TPA: carboxypeptidase-like regulatory domain-containing protein [Blastocatellia bacterium]|nr:carboxypeptidase-like regulatory domain-containing protein [Blastocatellia bacterium]
MSRRNLDQIRAGVLAICLLMICLCPAVVLGTGGQELSAAVGGVVVDSTGAAVAGARITLINDAMGFQRQTTTSDSGAFLIPLLPAGTYTLVAEMSGFATIRVTDVDGQPGMMARLEIVLNPKLATQTLTVKAAPNLISTSGATLSYSVNQDVVRSLPVIGTASGRSVVSSLSLLPAPLSPALDVGVRGEGIVNNGARPISNVFAIDGGDNNDYEQNRAAAPLPNPDALQDVSIVTSNAKASQVANLGAVIGVTLKSGTNQVHGNLRYLVLNEALNARSFFDPKRPPNRLNTFGGQVGGPLIIPRLYNGEDRTHFFVDAERSRTESDVYIIMRVMSAAERTGQLGKQLPLDPLTGNPFPGGVIPMGRFHPISKLYIDRFIPPPNFGERYYEEFASQSVGNTQYSVRIDHVINKASSVSATYFSNVATNDRPRPSPPLGRYVRDLSDHVLVLRETHSFSPNVINQVTASVVSYDFRERSQAPGFAGVHPSEAGFVGIRPQNERYVSLPSLSIFGGAEVSAGYEFSNVTRPQDSQKTSLGIRDDLVYTSGRHVFGFGGGTRLFTLDKYIANNSGRFSFMGPFFGYPPSATGVAFADFLLGFPSYYVQTTGNSQYLSQWSLSLYATDEIRIRRSLTLNLGIRYELTPPLSDKLGQLAVFRPGAKSVRFPDAVSGILYAGDPDPILGKVPPGGYPTDKNNVAPRIAIAYSPTERRGPLGVLLGGNRGVIRAGAGVFYDATYGYSASELAYTPPFYTGVLVKLGSQPDQSRTFENPFGSGPNPFPLNPGSTPLQDYQIGMTTFDPGFRSAYSYQYNLTVEREIPGSIVLDLSYVGSKIFKTDRQRDLNPIPKFNGVGPYPAFSDLQVHESSGRAQYDSLQLRLSRRFGRGVTFDATYAFGKALDNSSAPYNGYTSFQQTDLNPTTADGFRWARSAFDRRHNLVVTYCYSPPTTGYRGLAGLLVNGWQFAGITQLRSGMPMDLIGGDGNGNIGLDGRPDVVGPYRRFDPRQIRTFVVDGESFTGNYFFDPTSFQWIRARAHDGGLGRNVFDGPGINLTALSISKTGRLRDSHELEFRADIWNLFNHANFNAPETDVVFAPENFGAVQSAGPGRTIQLSVRYRF